VSPTTIGGHVFTVVGAVHPVAAGWLVVAAKMRGGSFVPDLPLVFQDLSRAIDGRPRFDVVGLNVAVGDPAFAKNGRRACDLACQALLGVDPKTARKEAVMPSLRSLMKQRRDEAGATIGPRHQRTVFEFLPELSLFQITDGQQHVLNDEGGVDRAVEALSILPGVDRIVDADLDGVTKGDLVRAALGLWTARRALARMTVRLPEEPVSVDGIRVELLR